MLCKLLFLLKTILPRAGQVGAPREARYRVTLALLLLGLIIQNLADQSSYMFPSQERG
jgi:hypothetical protein